eukprot:3059966-Prymnesium_polylepis.1
MRQQPVGLGSASERRGNEAWMASKSLRRKLEDHFCDQDMSGDDVKTPLVVLALHGDGSTLDQIVDYCKGHGNASHATPVVVIPETGGAAADIHSYCEFREQAPTDDEGQAAAAEWSGPDPTVKRGYPLTREYLEKAMSLIPIIYAKGRIISVSEDALERVVKSAMQAQSQCVASVATAAANLAVSAAPAAAKPPVPSTAWQSAGDMMKNQIQSARTAAARSQSTPQMSFYRFAPSTTNEYDSFART